MSNDTNRTDAGDDEVSRLREEWLKSVIGKTEEETRASVVAGGGTVRVLCRDGVHKMGTCDLNMNRVNLTVENGIVKEANCG